MNTVEFNYKGYQTNIPCQENDSFENICHRFAQKCLVDINTLFFLYSGNRINLKLKLSEVINDIDKERKKMSIVVVEMNELTENKNDILIKSNQPICPICFENAQIEIKDYKIKIFGCKNKHIKNDIPLIYYDNFQKVNFSKIICDVCHIRKKSDIFNYEMYKCNKCKQNLCPICKNKHDKKHSIINYDQKNFICEEHNEQFYSYCENCQKDICILCENKKHNGHNFISYGKILPNEEEIENKLNESEKIIRKFNTNIDEIINKLNQIKTTVNLIYTINKELYQNYNIKERNYEILQNLNNIEKNMKLEEAVKINNETNIMRKFEKILDIYNKITETNELNKTAINNIFISDNNKNIQNEIIRNQNNYEDKNYFEDSLILTEKKDKEMIKNWIQPNGNIYLELLYRATRDGDSYNDFHSKCDKEVPNISLIKLDNGIIIGGYTTIGWKAEKSAYLSDKDAFIFSLNSREKYNLKKELNGKNAVYHNNLIWCCCYGYCGDDLAISGNFLTKNDSYCGGTNGKYMSFETSNLKMIGIDKEGQINFKVKELELFAIRNELTLKNNIETLREMRESLEDSLIIKNKEDILMIKSWLSSNSEVKFKLLYRATRDGDSAINFHLKCDDKCPTICIIKLENERIIGGYTRIPWKAEDKSYISDECAFIFSINSKEKYNLKKELKGEYAIYHDVNNYCCCFGYCGDDLAIKTNFLKGEKSYCCGNGDNYYSFETSNEKMIGLSNKGRIQFKVEELEVYLIEE